MWQKASNCFCSEHKSSWRCAGWLFSDDDVPSKNLSLFFSSSPKAWSYLHKRKKNKRKKKVFKCCNTILKKKSFFTFSTCTSDYWRNQIKLTESWDKQNYSHFKYHSSDCDCYRDYFCSKEGYSQMQKYFYFNAKEDWIA